MRINYSHTFNTHTDHFIQATLTHLLTNYSHNYNCFTDYMFTQLEHTYWPFTGTILNHLTPSALSSLSINAVIVFASTTLDNISTGWKFFHTVMRLSWLFQLKLPGSVPPSTIYLYNFKHFDPSAWSCLLLNAAIVFASTTLDGREFQCMTTPTPIVLLPMAVWQTGMTSLKLCPLVPPSLASSNTLLNQT